MRLAAALFSLFFARSLPRGARRLFPFLTSFALLFFLKDGVLSPESLDSKGPRDCVGAKRPFAQFAEPCAHALPGESPLSAPGSLGTDLKNALRESLAEAKRGAEGGARPGPAPGSMFGFVREALRASGEELLCLPRVADFFFESLLEHTSTGSAAKK